MAPRDTADVSLLELPPESLPPGTTAILEPAPPAAEPNPADIAIAFGCIFRNASPGNFVDLRAFPEKGTTGEPRLFESTAIPEDLDLSAIIAAAVRAARISAVERLVLCLIAATFQSPGSATFDNVAEGFALKVDLDSGETEAAWRNLEGLLGSATLVAASGGTTDTGHPKLHLYWRLRTPTRAVAEHRLLEHVNKLIATYVGSDHSADSVAHPMRVPGSLHGKGEPVLSRIIAPCPEAEIDLAEAEAKLLEACDVVGIKTDAPGITSFSAFSAEPVPVEHVIEALAFIDNVDLEWDAWNSTLMAIYVATGGSAEGLDAALVWSAKSSKHDDDATRERWDHFRRHRPTRTGFGKLDAAARTNGWLGPSDEIQRLFGHVEAPGATTPPPPPAKIVKQKVREGLVGLPTNILDALSARVDPEMTEDGLADAFAKVVGHLFKFDWTTQTWMLFYGTYWRPAATGEAKAAMLDICHSAGRTGLVDPAVTYRIIKNQFVDAALKYAMIDRRVAVTSEVWNTDQRLQATPGGTVDLRTGLLRSADPVDMITQITTVAPAETADCPVWLQFLHFALHGDQELIAFLQKWFGYALTGLTIEQVLVFIFGPGGTGKSLVLSVIGGIMGTYARTAPSDIFMVARGDRHPADLHYLRDARSVTASETDKTRTWDEQRIKALTGGDEITSRAMRENFQTWRPRLKLTFIANDKPALRSVGDAEKRRLRLVEFKHKPEVPDLDLANKLREEWPAILRWLIDGCLAWQREGLRPPQAVLSATEAYFSEQDTLAQFIEEHATLDPEARIRPDELRDAFNDWLRRAGEKEITRREFKPLLDRRQDIRYVRVQGRDFLKGVGIKASDFPTPQLPGGTP